jgi:hypothetical protein
MLTKAAASAGAAVSAGAGVAVVSKPRQLYPDGPLWDALIETLPSVPKDVLSIVHDFAYSSRLFCVGSTNYGSAIKYVFACVCCVFPRLSLTIQRCNQLVDLRPKRQSRVTSD